MNHRPWSKRGVPKSKWKYRSIMAANMFHEPSDQDLIWGICYSCGKVETWVAGSCWRCNDCRVDMPWQQILPNYPWTRVPTSQEAIAYMKQMVKRQKKVKA